MTADPHPPGADAPVAGVPVPGVPEAARHRAAHFGAFVRARHAGGALVVQPRMGFGSPRRMRAGLVATRRARATTVGTITLDSYTRVGDPGAAARALREGADLNGYPIVAHPPATTARVLAGVADAGFPVQVRHGSAVPGDIFTALVRLRLAATEGGPVSYCLPYGRTPLAESVRNWADCTRRFAELADLGLQPHLETFGGCMLGQLCPPGQLVAISVLEALFFCRNGISSISVSYAQQTNEAQDVEAVHALRRLCGELLPTNDWHTVVYTYMGLYPRSEAGALRLLSAAARLAVAAGAERLIVKTVAEAHRIPTIEENVAGLEHAARAARGAPRPAHPPEFPGSDTYQEASALVSAVLNLADDVGTALLLAFRRGYLDIPYCLHPDNRGRTRSYLDPDGRLRWAVTGALPIPSRARAAAPARVTSSGLLDDLSYMRRKFDREASEIGSGPEFKELA
ncbi:methylaspartate mutase [Actinomadura sp. WMMA1423]|uniref:methylaspartate mutase n=1 Tax=Actinomadura sp. WMMA1423 TaxID=2591108 RepID=UPI001F0D0EF7|nr:methylaspartate mutase [Actinomadura sp. WMMA1423]